MAVPLGLVSPKGLAQSSGRSAVRAVITSVLATILACCVVSYMARSAKVEGGISLSEVSTTATSTSLAGARTTSLTGIISSAEQAMNALRHSVLSDNAQTALPLKTDDLLKTAMEEQMKDSQKGRNSVSSHRWEEAADHTRKSAISHALMDVAKATKEGHDLEHLASHVGEAHSHHSAGLVHQEDTVGDHSSKRSSAWAEAADHTSKSAISNALLDVAKAKKEKIQSPMAEASHGDGGRQHAEQEEAADHTSKSAISNALKDIAKVTNEGNGLVHLASHVGEAHSHHSAGLVHQHKKAHGDNSSKHSSVWAEAADHTSKSAISNALLDVAKAKKEKIQSPMAEASHGDGGRQHAEQEEAADHTSKSAISNALKDIAKVTKESQGFGHNGGPSSKQQEAATDHDDGMSKANMQLAAKLQEEMKRDGDRERSETLSGGRRQSKTVTNEAEDMDHGKVSEQQFELFKHALREQQGKWDRNPSKVEQEAEMEQHKDTMLASKHEIVDK